MFIASMALVLLEGLTGPWAAWTPRAEIAPRVEVLADGSAVLSGAGNAAVFGGAEQARAGVEPGAWYRFSADYEAQSLSYESRQVVARLDWQSAEGKRAGQPDYAWRVTSKGARRSLAMEAPAPEDAASVKVQLLLVNAPSGKVTWSGMRFERINTPKSRLVRIASVRLRPKGPAPVLSFESLVESKIVAGSADIVLLPEGVPLVGTGKKYADVANP